MAAGGAPRDREGAAGVGDGEARGVGGVREGTRGREGTDGGGECGDEAHQDARVPWPRRRAPGAHGGASSRGGEERSGAGRPGAAGGKRPRPNGGGARGGGHAGAAVRNEAGTGTAAREGIGDD